MLWDSVQKCYTPRVSKLWWAEILRLYRNPAPLLVLYYKIWVKFSVCKGAVLTVLETEVLYLQNLCSPRKIQFPDTDLSVYLNCGVKEPPGKNIVVQSSCRVSIPLCAPIRIPVSAIYDRVWVCTYPLTQWFSQLSNCMMFLKVGIPV